MTHFADIIPFCRRHKSCFTFCDSFEFDTPFFIDVHDSNRYVYPITPIFRTFLRKWYNGSSQFSLNSAKIV